MTQIISLILPVLISGSVLIIVLKLKTLSFLDYPLDFNLTVGSKRFFGKNKTLKGLSIFVLFSIITCYVLKHIYLNGGKGLIHPVFSQNTIQLGLLFGLSYEAGELLNSFIKRRIEIAPGETKNSLQHLFDLSDGVITTASAALLFHKITVSEAILTGVFGILIHLFTDQIMIKMKLKKIF